MYTHTHRYIWSCNSTAHIHKQSASVNDNFRCQNVWFFIFSNIYKQNKNWKIPITVNDNFACTNMFTTIVLKIIREKMIFMRLSDATRSCLWLHDIEWIMKKIINIYMYVCIYISAWLQEKHILLHTFTHTHTRILALLFINI